METNILLLTDSYKATHWKQYPSGTTRVFSFFESRGGKYDHVIFFGLQYFIKKYLMGRVVTSDKIKEAKEVFAAHLGNAELFNEAGWLHILKKHDGYLPIEINAVPEGTRVPTGNVLMTVVNTDPEVPWLTNYIETLLVQVWYPTTVATRSFEMKKQILEYLEETGTPEEIDFKLHDFGFRGSTSVESAGIGGAAHLVNFKGTDTVEALLVARHYYGEPMAGFSIPAAEHSTITSWGREGEAEAYKNMLKQYPTGLVAMPIDSYDIYNASDKILGEELKEEILKRDGVTIGRPDSGDATKVVPDIIEIFGKKIGATMNKKGYYVLDPKLRIIQGDGIDEDTLGPIMHAVKNRGWSIDNVNFGSGGGLLQKLNRDTQRFAFKCSAIEIEGAWRNVMKDPVTDPGKRSKAGRLALVYDKAKYGGYKTVTLEDAEKNGDENLLKCVFASGMVFNTQKFADIRKRAAAEIGIVKFGG